MTDPRIAHAVEAEMAVNHNPFTGQVLALLRDGQDPDLVSAALSGALAAIQTARASVLGPIAPLVLPGDAIQIITATHPWHASLAIVEQTRSWGVELMTPAVQFRAKLDDLHVLGPAALLPPEVLAARRAALEGMA